jgi:hypothetical protein
MKTLIYTVASLAVASFVPGAALAADLGGYEERDTYVERPARVIERERIVEHRYYAPEYYDDGPVVTYYGPRRVYYPYYASAYPYLYAPRFYHRHWRGYGRW